MTESVDREVTWKRRALRSVLKSKTATAGGIIICVLMVLAVIGPYIAPYDPIEPDLNHQNAGFSSAHWLGTDHLGRDQLSRLLHGARVSIGLSVSSVGLSLLVGVPLGLWVGYAGGAADNIVMRFMDILLGFPGYLLAILFMAVLGPSLSNITLAVAISMFPGLVRVVRGDTLRMRHLAMVEAARSIGAGTPHILFKYILPNILSSILVVSTLRLGTAILVEASLSFLGLGLSPPTPAWGLMANEGLKYLLNNSWNSTLPGLAIMLTVFGFNLFGDGLRDALDPSLKD